MMNTDLRIVDDSQELSWAAPEETPDRWTLALMVLGLLASVVAFLSLREAMRTQLKPDQLYSPNIVKSQLYYVTHGIHIALLLAAGVMAWFSAKTRDIERGYTLRFLLFLGAAVLMTVRGYSLPDLLSTKLVDGAGPVPCLLSLLIFVGARRANWPAIHKVMVGTAVVFSAFTILGLGQLHTFTRPEAVAGLTGILNVLYWPASWLAFKRYEEGGVGAALRFVPILLYGIGSLFTQTRLNFVMLLAVLGVYAWLQYRRDALRLFGWMTALVGVVWIGMFAAIFLSDVQAFEKVAGVATAFSSRIDEDTRTGQLVSFSENVPRNELVLGRGAMATWNWDGEEWRGGTDVGYLTLLLYGGLPLLIAYIATHISPGWRAFVQGVDDTQCTAACIVLLWGLRMFSSSYPNLSLEYYPVLLCLGIAIHRPSEVGQAFSLQAGF